MLANLTRFWTAYVAGIDGYSFYRFLVYSAVASLGWVSLVAFIGFIAKAERGQVEAITLKAGYSLVGTDCNCLNCNTDFNKTR